VYALVLSADVADVNCHISRHMHYNAWSLQTPTGVSRESNK